MPLTGRVRIIGGKWRGRLLPVHQTEALRPTPNRVRETLFNWLQQDLHDVRCLDLFAGTGALGFEALSRGAKQVVFVESHQSTLRLLEKAATQLNAEAHCQFRNQKALSYLEGLRSDAPPFDVIFLDPPFQSTLLASSLRALSTSPCVNAQTLIYVESASPLEADALPAEWQLLKQKKASQIYYHLIRGGA